MVLSKGHEVVGPGYSRMSGDVVRVMDRGRELDNPNRVGWVPQDYGMDRRTDWVTRGSQDNWDGGSGQQADQVTWVSHGNGDSNPKSGNSSRVNRVGNTEQKIGGSSRVVNTKSWVVQNLTNTERRLAENSANTKSWVMQDSGGGGARNQKQKKVLLQPKG
jgi:hypothetical protein